MGAGGLSPVSETSEMQDEHTAQASEGSADFAGCACACSGGAPGARSTSAIVLRTPRVGPDGQASPRVWFRCRVCGQEWDAAPVETRAVRSAVEGGAAG